MQVILADCYSSGILSSLDYVYLKFSDIAAHTDAINLSNIFRIERKCRGM